MTPFYRKRPKQPMKCALSFTVRQNNYSSGVAEVVAGALVCILRVASIDTEERSKISLVPRSTSSVTVASSMSITIIIKKAMVVLHVLLPPLSTKIASDLDACPSRTSFLFPKYH